MVSRLSFLLIDIKCQKKNQKCKNERWRCFENLCQEGWSVQCPVGVQGVMAGVQNGGALNGGSGDPSQGSVVLFASSVDKRTEMSMLMQQVKKQWSDDDHKRSVFHALLACASCTINYNFLRLRTKIVKRQFPSSACTTMIHHSISYEHTY